MLRKLQINLSLWLLRRNIPQLSEISRFPSSGLVMDGSDPCQLQRDAKVQSGLELAQKYAAFEAALILDEQRAMALMMCEQMNSGGGSNGG
jgi:hypothetical protein